MKEERDAHDASKIFYFKLLNDLCNKDQNSIDDIVRIEFSPLG